MASFLIFFAAFATLGLRCGAWASLVGMPVDSGAHGLHSCSTGVLVAPRQVGFQFPNQGSNPHLLQGGFLITEPPEKSRSHLVLLKYSCLPCGVSCRCTAKRFSFMYLYIFLEKTIASTRRTLVGKVMSLLLNMLSRLVLFFQGVSVF